jgi:hypothetical protein
MAVLALLFLSGSVPDRSIFWLACSLERRVKVMGACEHGNKFFKAPSTVIVSIFVVAFSVFGITGVLTHDRAMVIAGFGAALFLAVTFIAQAWYD